MDMNGCGDADVLDLNGAGPSENGAFVLMGSVAPEDNYRGSCTAAALGTAATTD